MLLARSKFYVIISALIFALFSIYRLSMNVLTTDEERFISDFFILIDDGDVKFQYVLVNYYFSILYKISPYANVIINIVLTFWLGSKFIETFGWNNNINWNGISKGYFLVLFLLPANVFFMSAFLRDYHVFLVSLLVMILLKDERYLFFFFCTLFSILLRTESFLFFVLAFFFSKYRFNFLRFIPLVFVLYYFLIMYTPLFDTIVVKTIALQNETQGLGVFQLPFNKGNAFLSSLLNWPMFFFPMFVFELKTIFHYFFLLDSLMSFAMVLMAVVLYSRDTFSQDRVYRFSAYMICLAFVAAIAETNALTIIRHKIMYMPFIFYLAFSNFRYKFTL
ncbi:hypothetical protein WB865_004054 [Vibrio vulnificus]|nr:hypothetical protein [Vibrio vulnificus]EIC2758373.1 hypothetical protein [Vibrio vulnificus]EJA3582486.1 hypothetical protein [Vibrio vulnificus]ELP6120053.1 hypothetical protein [Vibrio vulnificus]